MNWRASREHRTWRAKVIRRDGRCVICNSMNKREAHHINHSVYFTELRFDINNGIALCKQCHSQFHTNFKRSSKEKCDNDDWVNFVTLVEYIKGIK